MKVAVVGPLCKDIIRIDGETNVQPGGVTYYTGTALNSLGVPTVVYGSLSDDFQPEVSFPLHRISSTSTLTFCNEYPSGDPDRRMQRAHDFRHEIRKQDVKGITGFDCVVFGPLIHGDIGRGLVESLPERVHVVLAPQGLIRHLEGESVVWKEPEKAMPYLSCSNQVFLDDKELQFITGTKDIKKGADHIRILGVSGVYVTRGFEGSMIFTLQGDYRIPAFAPKAVVDPTGAGDSYLAGYLAAESRGMKPNDAGRFAAMTSTMAIETRGPFRGTFDDVIRRLALERR